MKVLQPTLVISPSIIPNAYIGVPYSQEISVNSESPASWSVASALPPGFTLSPSGATTAIIACANPQTPFDAAVIIVSESGGQVGVANY